MPKFFEVYGSQPAIAAQKVRRGACDGLCPFTQSLCDGGGNRHQTKIKLTEDEPLRPFFVESLDAIVPGVCAIDYGASQWTVCPRRLLGFKKPDGTPLQENLGLRTHEGEAMLAGGLPAGILLGVWAEVYLQMKEDDTEINYHFDFVIAPLYENATFQTVATDLGVQDNVEFRELLDCARKGGLVSGRIRPTDTIPLLPDLRHPYIFEVMTASTSGSNTARGTDIASAFRDSLLSVDHEGPGINKRQVWGRMATQLFAKSALAEEWGGKTFWVVQDQLIDNLQTTTKLDFTELPEDDEENVYFIVMKYDNLTADEPTMAFRDLLRVKSGLSFSGSNTCADILLPKQVPGKDILLKCVLRRELQATLRL